MKVSPTVQTEQVLSTEAQRFNHFFEVMRNKVEYARDHRRDWLEDKHYWWRRRYGKERGIPNYPWVGASEIVMPLIDMVCDRHKAMIAGYLLNTSPPVTVLAATSAQQKAVPTIEGFFEWLVKVGSPAFLENMVLGTDPYVECGRMIMKSYWASKTRTAPEFLSRRLLPQELRRWISVGSEQSAQAARQLTGMEFQSESSFKANKKQIQRDLQIYMDLDPSEAKDRDAMETIERWLRNGTPGVIEYEKLDRLENAPAILSIDPEYVIVPPGTTGIEQTPEITHEMMFTETELKQVAHDHKWQPGIVKEILDKGLQDGAQGGMDVMAKLYSDRDDYEANKWRSRHLYRIYETCTYLAPTKHAQDQKVVITWSPDFTKAPLKAVLYQRPSGKWPYHTAPFELNNRDWYSPRGVAEKLNDLDWEITQQHRSKLNRMTIANAPVFTYRMHGSINPENVRWVPGQMIPTRNPGEIEALQVPNLDISFVQEEQILRTWAEQYLGSADFGLTDPLSQTSDARTATEIRTIQSLSKQSLTLRAIPIQIMLREIYSEFFDMWQLYGPEEVYVRVTGEEPLVISREDLQGDYLFLVSGAIGEDDPALKTAKAMSRLNLLLQVQQAGGLGDQYELNMGEAVLEVLQSEDVRAAKRIIRERSPQEIQALQQQREEAAHIQGMMAGMGAKPPGGGGSNPKGSQPKPRQLAGAGASAE